MVFYLVAGRLLIGHPMREEESEMQMQMVLVSVSVMVMVMGITA